MIGSNAGLGSQIGVRAHRRAGLRRDRDEKRYFFGALLAAVTGFFADTGAAAATAIGAGEATGAAIGTGLEGATIGAGLGAAEAGITGHNPLTGALTGGLTGGAVGGLGGVVGNALDIGPVAADALVGAGAGALGGAVTGGSPVSGAVSGGLGGALTGSLGTGGATPGGGGGSAISSAAPSSVGLDLVDGQFSGGLGADITPNPAGASPYDAAGNPVGAVPTGETLDPASAASISHNIRAATASPTAGAGGTTPSGTTNWSNLSSDPLGTLISGAKNNPGLALGGALVGYEGLKQLQGLGVFPGYNQIVGAAGQLGAQATQLQSYLTSGTLPPGVQTAINQATTSAQAAIRSQYASRGMSGSSAEAADLANAERQAVSQGTNIAMQLLNQGVSEARLSASLYQNIMQASLQQDAGLGQALAVLAAGAAKPSITLTGATSG